MTGRLEGLDGRILVVVETVQSRERGRTCVVVVRLWLEGSEEPTGVREWRGEVRHVESKRMAYFRHLDGIAGAIGRVCAEPSTPGDEEA